MTKNPLDGLTVLSTGEDRDEWLRARLGVITATKAAAIAGSHPYTPLIDVWNEATDPDYDPEHMRNKWLDERAQNGNDREAAIIEWASADPRTGGAGNPFIASSALIALPKYAEQAHPFACTPDGYKLAGDHLILIEAKTSSQDWEATGLPQHVYDQCQWQMLTTDAYRVWVALEVYVWSGKGATRTATLTKTWLHSVARDDRRIEFLLGKVEQFLGWLDAGIAPESDIDLRALEAPGLDATEDEVADWEELATADDELTELAEIRERIAADLKRAEVLEKSIKSRVKVYDGRRVHLVGSRMIAKLVRFTRETVNTKALDEEQRRALTTWSETERVVFEKNPEAVAQ